MCSWFKSPLSQHQWSLVYHTWQLLYFPSCVRVQPHTISRTPQQSWAMDAWARSIQYRNFCFLNYKLISTWVCDENVWPVLNEHDCPTDGLCSYFYLSKDNLAYAILGVFFTHCYAILSKVKFCGPYKILPFTNSKVLFLLHTCEGTSFWYITKASLAQLSPGCGGLTLAGAHPAALSFPHLSWTGERK